MSRRKHLLQSLDQEVEPPAEGQHIVRALGSRGSNIIEVEFPDGRSTLCLLPARFHKKLWVRNGSYLIVEDAAEAEQAASRVTGQIVAVLFAEHVKQLRKMEGVWPPEFAKSGGYEAGMASQAAEQLAALGVAESDEDEGSSSAARRQAAAAAAPAAAGEAAAGAAGEAAGAAAEGGGDGYASSSGSEDSLPPIPRFNNRKVIEYAVSSDSEDE